MRADYIKPSIYTKIYHLLTYENALALRLSLETGMRIGDCLALRPSDINGNIITFTAQKTGKKGRKKISSDLAKRLMKISNKDFVFVGRSGDKPRTRQAVWKDVKKAVRELKLDGNPSVHSARKTYGVEVMHDKGFSAAQRELQHDRAETTMLYAYSDILFGGGGDRDLHKLCKLILDEVMTVKRLLNELADHKKRGD